MLKGEKVGREIIILYFHRVDSEKVGREGGGGGKSWPCLKLKFWGKMGLFGKDGPLAKLEGCVDFEICRTITNSHFNC